MKDGEHRNQYEKQPPSTLSSKCGAIAATHHAGTSESHAGCESERHRGRIRAAEEPYLRMDRSLYSAGTESLLLESSAASEPCNCAQQRQPEHIRKANAAESQRSANGGAYQSFQLLLEVVGLLCTHHHIWPNQRAHTTHSAGQRKQADKEQKRGNGSGS